MITFPRFSSAASRLELALFRTRHRLNRWRRAFAYARGSMSEDAARQIAYDVRYAAGSFPLITLDVEDVLGDARELWEDHPALPRLCREAAERVSSKFDDCTEVRSSCAEWALELVAGYAESGGIALVEMVDTEDEDEEA